MAERNGTIATAIATVGDLRCRRDGVLGSGGEQHSAQVDDDRAADQSDGIIFDYLLCG